MNPLERDTVRGEPYRPWGLNVVEFPKPDCECGDRAYVRIKGKNRCWECAEDEGVERI